MFSFSGGDNPKISIFEIYPIFVEPNRGIEFH